MFDLFGAWASEVVKKSLLPADSLFDSLTSIKVWRLRWRKAYVRG
jgi:hypothetical protein